MSILLALALLAGAPQPAEDANDTHNDMPDAVADEHPEARVYTEGSEVHFSIADAFTEAAISDKRVIIVMGANWCHDSRALAGWFETPRFKTMLKPLYEIVYVDAGTPQRRGEARNQDIVKRFKGKKQKNTPYVMIISPYGSKLLNRKDARSWRNAASRSEDEIYDYFANAEWEKKE